MEQRLLSSVKPTGLVASITTPYFTVIRSIYRLRSIRCVNTVLDARCGPPCLAVSDFRLDLGLNGTNRPAAASRLETGTY